jgi:DNA-binding beta-propeller fold protein YncE
VPLRRADGGSAGPIDPSLAESPGGRSWLITSNGSDESVSLIDRDRIAACVAAHQASCTTAEVLRVKTKVPGGAPESVGYDPVMNRIFVVNKNILSPSLSVIQITENPDGSISGDDFQRIPLRASVQQAPVPALIAFDVVVQDRR